MKHADEIRVKLKEKYLELLLARGMNRMVTYVKPFTLKPSSFTSNVEGLKPKSVTAGQQSEWVSAFLKDPERPVCYCVSSSPNDRQAKALAAFMMQAFYETGAARYPAWHDLMGSFQNPLLNPEASKPGLLVLGNVMPNSTAVKLEKLRDCLEHYSDIPRIVVTSGEDPFTFFNKRMYYPLNGCVFLKTDMVKPEIEI